MATQPASANVTASQNLLLWSGWDEGIGAYDSVDFYTRMPQTLMLAMLTNQDGFAEPAASWDLGLLDKNGLELSGNGYGRGQISISGKATSSMRD